MVTFKSSTDTHQISAANSRLYLILLVPFWKMISFETNGLRVLGAKWRCFQPRLRSSAKATRYADETLLFSIQRDSTAYEMIEHFQ